MSSFPYGAVTDSLVADQSAGSVEDGAKILRLVKFFRFIKVLRLLRIAKLKVIVTKVIEYSNSKSKIFHL